MPNMWVGAFRPDVRAEARTHIKYCLGTHHVGMPFRASMSRRDIYGNAIFYRFSPKARTTWEADEMELHHVVQAVHPSTV
jgi:hypothetical protein